MPIPTASRRRTERTRARARAGTGKDATGIDGSCRRERDFSCRKNTSVCEADARFGRPDPQRRYRRARYYDPAAGRWISQDPIGFAAGDANLYRYVGNGPTTKTDPSGLWEFGFPYLITGPSWPYSLGGERSEEDQLLEQLAQVGIDIAGIVDPTPICDGASGLISLKNGDFVGAGISVASMVPWIGDLAKAGKAPRLLEIVRNAVQVAAKDERFAALARPLLTAIRGGVAGVLRNSTLVDCLPEATVKQLSDIQRLIDDLYLPKIANLRTLKDSRLKNLGISAEDFKQSVVGAKGSIFNVAVGDNDAVFLVPVRKGSVPPVETGLTLDQLPDLFPFRGRR